MTWFPFRHDIAIDEAFGQQEIDIDQETETDKDETSKWNETEDQCTSEIAEEDEMASTNGNILKMYMSKCPKKVMAIITVIFSFLSRYRA